MSKGDRIETLISRLSGTCDSMSRHCEDLELSDLDDCGRPRDLLLHAMLLVVPNRRGVV